MAKKPPQPPKPPSDDFDPDFELGEEIAPIEDVGDDDLIVDVVEDEDDAAAPVEVLADDALLNDDVVAEEAVVEVADDDMFADVAVDEEAGVTELVHGGADQPLPDVEVDADDALAEVAAEDEVGEVAPVMVDDEELSPHEAETMGEMAALGDDDPFADVGAVADEGDLEPVLVGAGGGGDEPIESLYQEEAPKPKLHWLTWTMIGLNVVAVLAAPYLLLLDYQKRQQYAHAVFMIELRALGVPSEEEEHALSAARVTLPGFHVSPEDIKNVLKERGFSVGDRFEAVDEPFLKRIPPSMLTTEILGEHFEGGVSVKTVEEEVKRLQNEVVRDIKNAAEESFKALKTDADKRKQIERLLHPLAMDTYQSEKLDKQIKSATGAELAKLYTEAAERRMAFDFLLPLELFRPGETKGMFVESIGDLKALPLDKVLERVTDRIKSTIDDKYQPALHLGEEWGNIKRDTIEKRLTISFTMLSLAHVKKPDGELLDPKLLERIPRVMGQYDFALACELFPSRVLGINEKVLERIKIDRDGFEVPNKAGAVVRGKAFIDYYEDELQRIRFLQDDIFKARLLLKNLQEDKSRYETLVKQRTEQRDAVLVKIASARAKTAKDVAELRLFQEELFRYQVELATSEDQLSRVHQEIRDKQGATGGKQP